MVVPQAQPVAQGILAGPRVYDATMLEVLFEIAGAYHCAPLPSQVRVVCTGSVQQTGHQLFVIDLRTRARIAEWTAGFDTGTPFVATPPMLIRSVGSGRVAISYGSSNKLGTYGPSSVAFYSHPAFE